MDFFDFSLSILSPHPCLPRLYNTQNILIKYKVSHTRKIFFSIHAIFSTSIEVPTMDTKKMIVCVLVMMVLISTLCQARYVNDDLEEAKALDKRRAMFDKVFKRGFAKRQVDSSSTTLH